MSSAIGKKKESAIESQIIFHVLWGWMQIGGEMRNNDAVKCVSRR
jgi:hypothetical protein